MIDAKDVEEGFDAPRIERVEAGQPIAILYEADVPVHDGRYRIGVATFLESRSGPTVMERIDDREAAADGKTVQVVGDVRYATDPFTAGEVLVSVSVRDDVSSASDHRETTFEIVDPGNTDSTPTSSPRVEPE